MNTSEYYYILATAIMFMKMVQ